MDTTERLTEEVARLRLELADVVTGPYNPREHPARRARLVMRLKAIERMLAWRKQGKLL